jgi:hypothetical protein
LKTKEHVRFNPKPCDKVVCIKSNKHFNVKKGEIGTIKYIEGFDVIMTIDRFKPTRSHYGTYTLPMPRPVFLRHFIPTDPRDNVKFKMTKDAVLKKADSDFKLIQEFMDTLPNETELQKAEGHSGNMPPDSIII